jgi:hypothetical protein
MARPLSHPEKEVEVIGYLSTNGFAGVPEPCRTDPKAFIKPLCAVIYEAAVYLHRRGKTPNTLALIDIIEQENGELLRDARKAAADEGLPDWQTFLFSAGATSLVCNPAGGEIVAEYLADIAEAARNREGAKIARKYTEGEIGLAEAHEEMSLILEIGTAQQIEPLLDARRIRIAHKPPDPPLVFGLAGNKISTAGNLTILAAQAKAGKTAAVGAMLARLFAEPEGGGDFLGFEATPPDGKAVVLFDTEQSPFDAWRVMNRAMKRAELEREPSNLRAYFTLDLSIQDRRRALQAELKRASKVCGGIHAIFIDGVADLCEDVNDPREANGLVDELVALSVRYNCPVVCILHENPGNPRDAWKTRGHLGSQLERKAESNLRVKKDGEGVSVIYSERGCRQAEIPEPSAPRFKFCENAGMHISCEPAGNAKAEADLEAMIEEVRAIFDTPSASAGLTWSEIHERIREVNGIEQSGARKRFDKLKAARLIKKNAAGLYTR